MSRFPKALSVVITGNAEEFASSIMETTAGMPDAQREAIACAYCDAFLRRLALMVGADAARMAAMAALGIYAPQQQTQPDESRRPATPLSLVKTGEDAKK